MNMRYDMAEKAYSCPVISEKDQIQFGSMQIKTFFSEYGKDNDKEIDLFLSEEPRYITSIVHVPSQDGTKMTTKIGYRKIIIKNANT